MGKRFYSVALSLLVLTAFFGMMPIQAEKAKYPVNGACEEGYVKVKEKCYVPGVFYWEEP